MSSLTIEQILDLLRVGPVRIAEYTEGLEAAQLHRRPEPDSWSVNDVLAHLRSCADVWGDCIRMILKEDHPTFNAVNPRSWVKQTDYPRQDFQLSFQAFREQRAELLALLESLAPESWERGATVTGAGRPLERTVTFYARWLATHERSHVKQVKRLTDAMRVSTP
jgi:hypothetical protein